MDRVLGPSAVPTIVDQSLITRALDLPRVRIILESFKAIPGKLACKERAI
jgi:hypothetical protein